MDIKTLEEHAKAQLTKEEKMIDTLQRIDMNLNKLKKDMTG